MISVKITDPGHPLFEQIIPVELVYYDLYHTGSSPDLFSAKTEGGSFLLLSTQIDAEGYWAQKKSAFVAELGADVGDWVLILKSGSGWFSSNFDLSVPHRISKIGEGGHVEFDDGMAGMYKPRVEIVERIEQ